jgi:hypothetical protein
VMVVGGIAFAVLVDDVSALVVGSGILGWSFVSYVVSPCHTRLLQSKNVVPIRVSGRWASCGVWKSLCYLPSVRRGERVVCGGCCSSV